VPRPGRAGARLFSSGCRLAAGVAFVAGVLLCLGGAEGVGDALVGGAGLPVDAVRVDLEQDGDAGRVSSATALERASVQMLEMAA